MSTVAVFKGTFFGYPHFIKQQVSKIDVSLSDNTALNQQGRQNVHCIRIVETHDCEHKHVVFRITSLLYL